MWLTDCSIHVRLWGKIYRMDISSALLYGSRCWAFRMDHIKMRGVSMMDMFKWFCRYHYFIGIKIFGRMLEWQVLWIRSGKIGCFGLGMWDKRLRKWRVGIMRIFEAAKGGQSWSWMYRVNNDMKKWGLQEPIGLGKSKGWKMAIVIDHMSCRFLL